MSNTTLLSFFLFWWKQNPLVVATWSQCVRDSIYYTVSVSHIFNTSFPLFLARLVKDYEWECVCERLYGCVFSHCRASKGHAVTTLRGALGNMQTRLAYEISSRAKGGHYPSRTQRRQGVCVWEKSLQSLTPCSPGGRRFQSSDTTYEAKLNNLATFQAEKSWLIVFCSVWVAGQIGASESFLFKLLCSHRSSQFRVFRTGQSFTMWHFLLLCVVFCFQWTVVQHKEAWSGGFMWKSLLAILPVVKSSLSGLYWKK